MAAYQEQRMYAELESIMHCPVCFEMPEAPIFLCNMGHHICKICHKKLKFSNCPMCHSPFSGTRNFLAEELVQKLPFLCVADNPNDSEISEKINNNSDSRDEEKIKPPQYCCGNFPCHLRSCMKQFPAGRMLPHIRYHHPTLLSEVTNTGRKYKEAWQLEYKSNKSYETAILVSNMGLFFLLTNINNQENFSAVVLMLASTEIASFYSYKIKISDTKDCRTYSYRNVVLSCRENPLKRQEEGDYFMMSCIEMSKLCTEGDYFHCILTIENKNPGHVDSVSSSPESLTYPPLFTTPKQSTTPLQL